VSSPAAAGRAKASLFASLTFLDRASLRGLRSPSTAMVHRGRYWPRYHEGRKPITTTEEGMKNEVIESGPWAGFEVIHRYTRAQAIADGVLVDVTAQAKGCGFKLPVAMTSTLFADCESWADGADWGNGEPTAEQFVRWLLCFACETIRASKETGTDRLTLSLSHFAGHPTCALIHIGPGDEGEPVVTLMYPGEE